MKNHEKSEALLKQILEADPADATANNDLGYQWADRSHNLAEAEKLILKALDLDQKLRDTSNRLTFEAENAAYIDSLGWVMFRQGKLKEARQELEKASNLPEGSDDPVVWDHLGDVYFSLKEKQKSLESYLKAINLYQVVRTRRDAERVKDIKQKIELLELEPSKK
jgi:tetratricopeptide (TPR) repeat protein